MLEKRKSQRVPITLHLSISDLYKDDPMVSGIHDLDAPIQLVDISPDGIAFISECVLPTGYFFNASIQSEILAKEVFTVVKIIHSRALDCSHYQYGCQFTNKPENIELLMAHIQP